MRTLYQKLLDSGECLRVPLKAEASIYKAYALLKLTTTLKLHWQVECKGSRNNLWCRAEPNVLTVQFTWIVCISSESIMHTYRWALRKWIATIDMVEYYNRGHRADSFRPIDVLELNELRARNRTFNGAYRRTALATLGYALTALRLFDSRFLRSKFVILSSWLLPWWPLSSFHHPKHWTVGILYLVLSILLFALGYIRARHSRHDFSDRSKTSALYDQALPTVGQEDRREYGRPFITAGRDVVAVGALVMVVEILLLAFVLQMWLLSVRQQSHTLDMVRWLTLLAPSNLICIVGMLLKCYS